MVFKCSMMCTNLAIILRRSKSWTEHTDYPKENNAHYYARPYMRRQASTGGASLTLKTVLERSEAAMMFAEPPPPRRRALPALDREGKPPNDLRYLAPSPPERDGPGQKAEPQVGLCSIYKIYHTQCNISND